MSCLIKISYTPNCRKYQPFLLALQSRKRCNIGNSQLVNTFHVFILILLIHRVNAVLPLAKIELYRPSSSSTPFRSMHASIASFGPHLHFGRPSRNDRKHGIPRLISLAPTENELLCNATKMNNLTSDYQLAISGSIMLLARGECPFAQKVLNAQNLGAEGVIIYNNPSSRYKISSAGVSNATFIQNITWPLPRNDFECENARSWIPQDNLSFNPMPYNKEVNDAILVGDISGNSQCANLNVDGVTSFHDNCKSKRCVLTGTKRTNDKNISEMEACCAWDMYTDMNGIYSINNQIRIPSVYITMKQGSVLLKELESAGMKIKVVMYDRYYPDFNFASILIVMLGIFVTWLASWMSCKDYRSTKKKLDETISQGTLFQTQDQQTTEESTNSSHLGDQTNEMIEAQHSKNALDGYRIKKNEADIENNTDVTQHFNQVDNLEQEQHPKIKLDDSASTVSDFNGEKRNTNSLPSLIYPELDNSGPNQAYDVDQENDTEIEADDIRDEQSHKSSVSPPISNVSSPSPSRTRRQSQTDTNTFELTIIHAIFFLVMASASLLILFYLKLYDIVTVTYAIGCAGALSQVIFQPFYGYLSIKVKLFNNLSKPICENFCSCNCKKITFVNVLGLVTSYAIAITWLWYGFSRKDEETKPFYWITQDVMGACMCISFLGLIRLNSIKVATALLIAAFVYDIFFVFITPYIFNGDSVMVEVATSGGLPDDPDMCEKYPNNKDCKTGKVLPMLLTIPRINDFRGGMSMLGLGDIVLPGLLVSFTARLDSAKQIVKLAYSQVRIARATLRGVTPPPAFKSATFLQIILSGYFLYLTLAYSVGLSIAIYFVHFSGKGQPALLYLVPCCLFTVVGLGWRRKELIKLWKGPKSLENADRLKKEFELRGGIRISRLRN